MLHGKTIVLGISGGIAAYKGATICSRLTQAGANVHVIMTEGATQFITPLTLQTLSRNPVHIDTFDERNPAVVAHIDLADRADMIVIAPATANTIAKLALGLGDDMLSTTLLAASSPIVIAPAMNVHMYEHPAVVQNMQLLAERGVMFMEPGTGQLACGYVAKGRLAEPEDVVSAIIDWFTLPKPLAGKKVLVTAGGTMERLDPVRYLTNDSSGKMGFAIAEAALVLGAEVTVIAGRASASLPQGVQIIKVESAEQMLQAVLERYKETDVVIKAAAVADYRPIQTFQKKMKKNDAKLVLELERTTDILQTLGQQKEHQLLVGFAAETNDVASYAMEKLIKKNCDLIVANDVSAAGVGFNVDTNMITIYDRSGELMKLPLMSKRAAADQLMQLIADRLLLAKDGSNDR